MELLVPGWNGTTGPAALSHVVLVSNPAPGQTVAPINSPRQKLQNVTPVQAPFPSGPHGAAVTKHVQVEYPVGTNNTTVVWMHLLLSENVANQDGGRGPNGQNVPKHAKGG